MRLKELFEDVEWEKALKEVIAATVKEKVKVVEAAEKKVAAFEKVKVLVKKKCMELEMKLDGTKLKLAKAESLNLAQADDLAGLKAALEACENKWYNEGFAYVENSVELVVRQAQKLGFEDGWLAALQAIGVPGDSPLRNPEQIPFLDPSPAI